MSLFEIPGLPSTKESDKLIAKKTTKKPVKQVVKAGTSLSDSIRKIKLLVEEKLGKYKDKYLCIRTYEELKAYIDGCICEGICSIDTETTGLNPMLDDIVGFSIYTKTKKAAYIPINHIDLISFH